MTALSDTLTIGLVLVLLFGSIALYLYTRIQQAEQKITLLEHILLDLKMSAEIKTYTELPAEDIPKSVTSGSTYEPFMEDDDDDIAPGATVNARSNSPASSVSRHSIQEDDMELKSDIESYSDVIQNVISNELDKNEKEQVSEQKLSVNYESMTLKDLQSMAKQRGITSASTMKKAQIIEALKTSDRATSVIAEPIEPGSSGSSSFLETSSFLEKGSE
jgi:hypothetical protein